MILTILMQRGIINVLYILGKHDVGDDGADAPMELFNGEDNPEGGGVRDINSGKSGKEHNEPIIGGGHARRSR